jgi:hypothetical protein
LYCYASGVSGMCLLHVTPTNIEGLGFFDLIADVADESDPYGAEEDEVGLYKFHFSLPTAKAPGFNP